MDIVLDLTDDYSIIEKKLENMKFNTIICFSVLEHCKNPFKMCQYISTFKKKGNLFISVPFSWRIHGYPSDYWRFTSEGIKNLFPYIEFDLERSNITTCKIGEINPIDDYRFRVNLNNKGLKHYGWFKAIMIKILRRSKLLPFIFDYPYLFPPVLINMVGKKK